MARFSVALLMLAPTALAFVPSNGRFRQPSVALFDKKKVFIDGEAGTTGLQVRDRLAKRDDLEILSIPDDLRKDDGARADYINQADAVILCLPDEASIQAASWVEADNDRTVLIDASTAFRVDDAWTYGFPGMYARRLTHSSLHVMIHEQTSVCSHSPCRYTPQPLLLAII